MKAIISNLPDSIKKPLRSIKNVANYGNARYCPVCGRSSRRFRQFGIVPRDDAQCIRCGALERHRLSWLYLSKRTNLFDGKPKKVLHVAPEACFEPRLRQQFGNNYFTTDLYATNVTLQMDIGNIAFADHSFDVIYCSHVLEHIQDDQKVMREFFRLLKSDGWAILLVPINVEQTFEDATVTEPEERLKLFGQKDHVRNYGPDYAERLMSAGFSVRIITVNDLVQHEDIVRMGLTPSSGDIAYCTRQ